MTARSCTSTSHEFGPEAGGVAGVEPRACACGRYLLGRRFVDGEMFLRDIRAPLSPASQPQTTGDPQ